MLDQESSVLIWKFRSQIDGNEIVKKRWKYINSELKEDNQSY